jgi:urease accessory protein
VSTEGVLELGFCRGPDGRSSLRFRRQRFPLRTTMPFYLDAGAPDMAFVYVQNPTGGVFSGDRLLTRISVDDRVRVHLTSQSATKLYRMDGPEAQQELCFELASGGYIEHVPDALIPQAGASYRQRTRVELAPDAAFVAAETVAPGRAARGERHAYKRLDLTFSAHRDGRELCAERLLFEPGRARPSRAGVLGDLDYLVSVLVIAPDADAGLLAGAIDAALAPHGGAAGQLPSGAGALARALAADAVAAEGAMRAAWAAARRELLGLPLPERRK